MEYNAQNLEYAVSVFYKCEQGERSQAHQWLTAAQSCPDAWSFVWELLQLNKIINRRTANPSEIAQIRMMNDQLSQADTDEAARRWTQGKDNTLQYVTEVQFFAANTLHNKIKKCLNEVPQDNLEELRYKIVQAIFTFQKGPKIVLDRLCISLAALFLQVEGLTINDLTKPFHATEDRHLLLEILTAVPDQFSTMTMGNEQRTQTYRLMVDTQKLVLKSMHENLTDVHNLDTPVTEELIALWSATSSCLGAWLGMAGDVTMEEEEPQGVPPPDLADLIPIIESLLGVVYRIYSIKTVQKEAVADTALEACEAALQAVRVTLVAPNSHNYGRAAMDVASIILKLALPIIQQENVPQSPNEELLHSIYLLAVCLGEAHSVTLTREIANKNSVAESFLQLLLSCQTAAGRYPVDETRSSLTFGFWYHLQDEISGLINCYKKSEQLEIFRNIKSSGVAIFTQLLCGLLQKSAQPPLTHDQTEENKELWRRYRQDIADTLICCHTILKEVYWNTIEACWESAADDLQREAALHAVVALADSAPLSGARPPPALPAMLQRAAEAARPDLHPVLADTAIECLGAYAAWLGELCSEEQPEEQRVEAARWCAMALGAVGAAFQQAPVPCSLALQRLCSECPSQAAQFAPDIVRAVQVGWGNLEGGVLRRLLNAAGGALAAAPHADSATLIAKLTDTLINDMIPRQEGRESEWVASCDTALRAASSLLSGLSRDTVLCGAVLQALRPALPYAAPIPQLTNSLFNMIKQVVTVLMDDMQPMLDEICEITAMSLSTGPQPDSLHVVRLLVLMFVDNIACEERCRWLLQQTATNMLRPDYCSSPELIRERADVLEAFFTLLTSFAKKKPRCLDFIYDEMPKIVQLAGISMKLWEGNASRGACQFVAALAHERPLHVLPHAAALVHQACVCIGGALPRKYVDPMADLLLGLNRVPWHQIPPGDLNLGIWLRAALVPDNFPTRHAKAPAKNKFITAVTKEKSDKRRMLEAIREFSLTCRGLIGTEYGKQTEASRELVT